MARSGPSSSRDTCVDVDYEALGRQRPPIFKSAWSELGFCACILGSLIMAEFLIAGFHIVLPALAVELKIPEAAQTWPSSVFSLVTGACILPFGRLCDIHGAYLVFSAGMVWFLAWSLVAGFSINFMMLTFCRALAGLGAAAFLPAGLAMIAKYYRPGPRKNLVFALYGAAAPMGFFVGILIGGLAGQFLSWRWYFFLASMILGPLCVVSMLLIPRDYRDGRPDIAMDWWGVVTIVPGLILLVYSVTDSSQAPNGWASPQIIVTLVLGVLLLGAGIYVEAHVAKEPLLPADLFAPKYMKRLVVALFFTYGTYGIFLLYSSFFIELVLHKSPLTTAVWCLPMALVGAVLAGIGGATLHLLPGQILLFISGIANVLCVLLFAIMPEEPFYWRHVFPAMVCASIGIDITFTVSNIFITANVPATRQGEAGALINSLLYLGIAFFLGWGDVAAGQTSHLGTKTSYQTALFLGVGMAGMASVMYIFVKIGSATSGLTVEERQKLEAAQAETSTELLELSFNPKPESRGREVGSASNSQDFWGLD